jgi:hypothetical protein
MLLRASLRCGLDAAIPLFPGREVILPHSQVKPSLVQRGPVLFSGHGACGYEIRAAILIPPEAVVQEISKAKLRGRGGAGLVPRAFQRTAPPGSPDTARRNRRVRSF